MAGTPKTPAGTPWDYVRMAENCAGTPGTPGTPLNGTAGRKYVMRSPLFGLCNLIPQDAGTQPTGHTIGYVELEGVPEKLDVAIFDGKWRGRGLKPLRAPVARRYKVEKADGSPLL